MSDKTPDDKSPNANMAGGQHRIKFASIFDEESRPHYERFLRSVAFKPTDHVLDVGCGTGQSTRDAARAASQGSALGVDLAKEVLIFARRLGEEEGLHNLKFQAADAQVDHFEDEPFDLCISQFGSMFFWPAWWQFEDSAI